MPSRLTEDDKDWRDTIKVGDILLERGKSPRVVKRTSYNDLGILTHVTFDIKRLSWTGKPYTVVGRCDLVWREFKKSNVSVKNAKAEYEND